jgi:hypothetical protein
MKDVGIVGAPGSGKSTVFTALTRHPAPGGRTARGVVAVPDPRLEVLAALERSRKAEPARLQFVDVPGGTAAQALATLREADALLVVVRAFGPDPDPAAELADVTTTLAVADLGAVETALQTARHKLRTGRPDARAEIETLERAEAALSSGTRLAEAPLGPDDRKHLRGLAPLTLKPWVIVANLEEGTELPPGLPEGTLAVYAEIEAETAGMPDHEASALLVEFGVTEPSLHRVIPACYRALDLITFLTANENEARGWEIARGATAHEAAGAIHTDMHRGFIRAEVIAFDDLVSAGGWERAKGQGLVRVEGKEYVVHEGDILRIRFAV